jgi:dCTP deaminase
MILSNSTLAFDHYSLLDPFVRGKGNWLHPEGLVLSYGLSYAGYDIRLGTDTAIAPMGKGDFRLVYSLERFNMPKNLMGEVKDKSTLARRGLSVLNTVIEPGWRGFLTLELVMHGDNLFCLYPKMPIAQIVFFTLDKPVVDGYSGKYQDQGAKVVEAK